MVQMKQIQVKHTWVDDENHHLKGYSVDEMELVEESWWQIIVRKVKELIGK